ncbi:hypothetical protein [Carboxylicivirga sp. M1479]|uniref:hypothetical protein n=1 Tax=Carboxylicivirga sp. M1479 TaxID=2594476 RepID=UPI0011781837|nr:hypothetical protein [Carboxylicivirga sp. M1479]TRX66148.1 hypothetical protein FNN09_15225 [Carboxylicivirga sp. M1479]
MRAFKLSLFVSLAVLVFASCNKDDGGISAPGGQGPHEGNPVTIDLSYTDFVGGTLKSMEDYNPAEVVHNYISTGYTVTIIELYNSETGKFENKTFEDVDLANPVISFEAIGWFGIKVSHSNYSALGIAAYYSVDDPRIDVQNSGDVIVPLDLTQVSVHLANGTGQTFDSQIESASISGIMVSDFNLPVYVPADVDYVVDVTFQHDGGQDQLTHSGLAGQAFYHTIMNQEIGTGIIFDLPVFDTPTDGGGIGD